MGSPRRGLAELSAGDLDALERLEEDRARLAATLPDCAVLGDPTGSATDNHGCQLATREALSGPETGDPGAYDVPLCPV